MFKNNKAQSALEYLMTYGWALVVIVIVIAVLVFLINPTQIGTNTCTGFDKFPIKNHKSTTDDLNIIVTNETGQNVTGLTIDLTGKVAGATMTPVTTTVTSWPSNAVETIGFDYGTTYTAGSTYTYDLNLNYTDADGFARHATGSCKGTI